MYAAARKFFIHFVRQHHCAEDADVALVSPLSSPLQAMKNSEGIGTPAVRAGSGRVSLDVTGTAGVGCREALGIARERLV